MYYYQGNDRTYAALSPDLPLQKVANPNAMQPLAFLFDAPPENRRATFCVTDSKQLMAPESVAWLDPARIADNGAKVPADILNRIEQRALAAVNIRHPRWREAIDMTAFKPKRNRVHLLAVGDVGGTLLTGLKLLGGDCIETIGICDLNSNTVARWTAEMSQIAWPWDYDALPNVEAVDMANLFDCDVFIFAATKAIPAVGSAVKDVRMAQFAANRAIVEHYAKLARSANFKGLFIVLSDPVDPLCKAAYLASNQEEDGAWDGQGLLAEQVQGFGLGVMNARAAALAKQEERFRSFLTEGRSFGPHGEGLVIANSLESYDDTISQELTEMVKTANLRIREIGFKPYVAPALSSGAFQLLLTLRGQWHCGSVCLGGVWFGCRNRFTTTGIEIEGLALPDVLYKRLLETQQTLSAII
ncbi:lactate dehydrogenase [Oscillospiraceae bacterium LTW-04]|nr:lactate dehydrogenase [Oscillospiraceae bacterium MB24-C1]